MKDFASELLKVKRRTVNSLIEKADKDPNFDLPLAKGKDKIYFGKPSKDKCPCCNKRVMVNLIGHRWCMNFKCDWRDA